MRIHNRPSIPYSSSSVIANGLDFFLAAYFCLCTHYFCSVPCPNYLYTGRCKDGQKCPFKHDDTRVGICKTWLKGEECPANSHCHLQHEPSPHVVPHCRHFQRGWCTNDNCRYTHVHVRKDAPLCKGF